MSMRSKRTGGPGEENLPKEVLRPDEQHIPELVSFHEPDSDSDESTDLPPLRNILIHRPGDRIVTHDAKLSAPLLLDDDFEPEDVTGPWSHAQEGRGWQSIELDLNLTDNLPVDKDFSPVESPALPLEEPAVLRAESEAPRPQAARYGLSGEGASSADLERLRSEQIDADYEEAQSPVEREERQLSDLPPPALVMPLPRALKSPSMPSTGGWKGKLLTGVAALAGLFGVKIGFEKAEEVVKENIEAASDALEFHSGRTEARMAAASPALFDQQPSEPPYAAPEQESLTHTYTIQSGDSPWGIADRIIEASGIEDSDGTLTLQAVKGLREKNNIQGDAARSRSMWVGQELDLSPVYDLIASVKGPSSKLESGGATTSSEVNPESRSLSSDTVDAAPDVTTELSPELTSSTLNYPGETVWSRTQDIIESLGMKPNMAKRGVLGAIVLADSHMSETQAMRVKYAGHKKFDATRDTLNFDRAAQAALDLKNGMSPGDVAKKYGVKNQYEKLRDR